MANLFACSRFTMAGLIALLAPPGPALALPAHDWATLRHEGGAVVYPSDVFAADAGQGEPKGRVLATPDGRAHLHVFSVPNARGERPAQFLRRVFPGDTGRLTYTRVAGNFFAISQPSKGRRILYRRCNFAGGEIYCVDLQYPLAEKRAWDGIVTRVSLSLRPR